MPFESERQRRWMFKHIPDVAKRWSHEYGSKPRPKWARRKRNVKRSSRTSD